MQSRKYGPRIIGGAPKRTQRAGVRTVLTETGKVLQVLKIFFRCGGLVRHVANRRELSHRSPDQQHPLEERSLLRPMATLTS